MCWQPGGTASPRSNASHRALRRPFDAGAAWCQPCRGEVLGLRRRDVDPLHATITVEQTRTFSMTNKRAITKGPKTAGRRTLTVPAHVAGALADHLDRFVAQRPTPSS